MPICVKRSLAKYALIVLLLSILALKKSKWTSVLEVHAPHYPTHQLDRRLVRKDSLHEHVSQAVAPARNNNRLFTQSG